MSGRIRTIKPELLEDAITAGLSDSAFRVFIGMFLLADDYGNLRAEHKYLEGQIYWSAIPEKSVAESCKELSGDSHASLVTFYKVRGQAYAHIRGWSKHQKVQHPGKPRVPGPEMRDGGDIHETLTKVPETLTPDLRPPTSDHDHRASDARADGGSPEEPEEVTGVRHISDRPPAPTENAYDLARRLWSELWEAKYRRPYDYSPHTGPRSEDYVLQRVAASATGKVNPGGAEAYLRHKFAAYLRDHGTRGYLDEQSHPLRCLERDWAKYGEPKEPKRMVPRREEPPVELVSVEEMAARAMAAMKLVGNGGNGT